MMTLEHSPTPILTSPALEHLVDVAGELLAQARAPATRKAYRGDWYRFETWCLEQDLPSLPASSSTVALYLTARLEAGARVSTLERAVAAIAEAHRAAALPSPRQTATVRQLLRGIRRQRGVAPHQATPILIGELWAMVSAMPAGQLKSARDAALLLLGFAAALRRSELVALEVADLRVVPQGLELSIRRSKTDPEGRGALLGVPHGHSALCPVKAVQAWLDAAGIVEGALFRSIDRHGRLGAEPLSDRAVAEVVKTCAARAGLDPSRYSGHSLRAGLATQAALAGKSERVIMEQTRHRSSAMVRRYIRRSEIWQENAAEGIGL